MRAFASRNFGIEGTNRTLGGVHFFPSENMRRSADSSRLMVPLLAPAVRRESTYRRDSLT